MFNTAKQNYRNLFSTVKQNLYPCGLKKKYYGYYKRNFSHANQRRSGGNPKCRTLRSSFRFRGTRQVCVSGCTAGRQVIYPYSFYEFLEAQGIVLPQEWQYGSERSKVQQAFFQYLNWGGFPELLLYRNKRHWLNDLYEKILLGDIIQRNKVKNELALRLTLKRMAESMMQPTSYTRIAKLVKATGVSTSTASVID